MAETSRLSVAEIKTELSTIAPQWQVVDETLQRSFTFRDFADAFTFITAIALVAEKNQHHPNWENNYNKVNIKLTTHDVGGLSQLDFKLAQAIDSFAPEN
tara:strand:+ start:6382 stop:6681 length:300 start_codon:yes stop_codon:yes gene_type:complete